MSRVSYIDQNVDGCPDDAALRTECTGLDQGDSAARDETLEMREALPEAPVPRTSIPASRRADAYEARRNDRHRLRMLLMIGGILAVVIAGGITWLRSGRYVSTDDAYVHAAKLMVSTDVSGLVSSVEVHEGQAVKAGDILFRLDAKQFQIALDNTNASLAQTALTIEAMKQDYKRMLSDVAAQKAQVELDKAHYDRYATLMRPTPFPKPITTKRASRWRRTRAT